MSELGDNLEALQQQLKEAETLLAPIVDAKTLIQSEEYQLRQAYQEQMEALRKKRDALNTQQYEAQVQVNKIKWAIEDAVKKKAEAEAAAQKAAEEAAYFAEIEARNKELTAKFDQITIGAPWREWAKEHQMIGGQKIVQDRNVILADVMGLGKTLTSVIVVEMAERATKDASPDEPFLGEEVEVFYPARYKHRLSGNTFPTNSFNGRKIAADPNWEEEYELLPEGYVKEIQGGITRPVGRRVLYFCPNSLLRNVLEEWRMWAPHRNAIFVGNMTKAERKWALDSYKNLTDFVIICNYEAWRRDKALLEEFVSMHFDTVIIDEAHNIKDMKSIAYEGVDKILTETNPPPEYIIPMTGTPVLNRPQELFTMLHLVNRKEFYDLNDFLYRYCDQDEGGHWKFRPGGLDLLAKKISKNFLRRTKDDAGIKLPPQTVILHELDLDEENYPLQAKARKEMRDFATLIIDANKGKVLQATVIIALYTRLRQIETWPAGIVQRNKQTQEIILQLDVKESQKVDYVIHKNEQGEWDGLIPAAISDERMVLFSQFKAPLHEIRDRVIASGYRAVVFDGDTPDNLKEEIRADFDARTAPESRSECKWDIVLCNYRVGGVGLNLTAASQLIVLDEEWNPGKRDQAYGRLDRIGQTRPTTVHVIRNLKTIDDWLAGIMERKEDLVAGFEGAVTNAQAFKDALDSGLI